MAMSRLEFQSPPNSLMRERERERGQRKSEDEVVHYLDNPSNEGATIECTHTLWN